MPSADRRLNRSDVRYHALNLFLDGVRARHRAAAVALTTHDGLFIAGAGAPTEALEALGALGAARREDWNGARLHMRAVELDDELLALTCAGATAAHGAEVDAGIRRILA